jgi:DNA-binding PadR family transcriptional regulator
VRERKTFNFDWAKRTHKGLRRWVMYIVRDSPKTGAEIMNVMEANVQGWWRPSPGSIYPLLARMLEEGVLSESDKKYSLTDKGKEEVDHPFPWLGGGPQAPRSVEGVLQELTSYVSYLEDLAESDKGKLGENAGQIRELGKKLTKLGGAT